MEIGLDLELPPFTQLLATIERAASSRVMFACEKLEQRV